MTDPSCDASRALQRRRRHRDRTARRRPKAFPRERCSRLDRVGRAGSIADEVVAHLVGLVGSDVKVTLEIEAEIPSGAPEQVKWSVREREGWSFPRCYAFCGFGAARERKASNIPRPVASRLS